MTNKTFNEQELEFMRDRLNIEQSWGPEVYSRADLDFMDRLVSKIQDNLIHFIGE